MKQYSFLILLMLVTFGFISCKDNGTGSEEDKGPFGNLVWSDEFDGERLDYDKWTPETGAHGWGNNEWQNYTAVDNTVLEDGILKIVAKKVGEGQKAGDYTSARLNSNFSFTYGRVEVRAKIPDHNGNGLWPAIWMLGENITEVGWPDCGEIDMMEYVSYSPNTVHFTIHSAANNHVDGTQAGSGPLPLPSIEEEFHNYGILWSEDYIKFYVDDTSHVAYTFNKPQNPNAENWPFDKPFYILLNMAVGGNWGGAQGVNDNIFPAEFEIDYVRVYQ